MRVTAGPCSCRCPGRSIGPLPHEDAHLGRRRRPVADLVSSERHGTRVHEPRSSPRDAGVRDRDRVEEEVHVPTGQCRLEAEHLVVDDIAPVADRDPGDAGLTTGGGRARARDRRRGRDGGGCRGQRRGRGRLERRRDGGPGAALGGRRRRARRPAREHPRRHDAEREHKRDASEGGRGGDHPSPPNGPAATGRRNGRSGGDGDRRDLGRREGPGFGRSTRSCPGGSFRIGRVRVAGCRVHRDRRFHGQDRPGSRRCRGTGYRSGVRGRRESALLGDECRPQRHRVLRVSVHGDRPAGRLADHRGHERHARRPTDEQESVDPVQPEARALDHPPKHPDRVGDPWPDQALEVLPGQWQLGLQAGQHDSDHRVGLG